MKHKLYLNELGLQYYLSSLTQAAFDRLLDANVEIPAHYFQCDAGAPILVMAGPTWFKSPAEAVSAGEAAGYKVEVEVVT